MPWLHRIFRYHVAVRCRRGAVDCKENPHNRHPIDSSINVWYGDSFVSIRSDLNDSLVIEELFEISCYFGLRHGAVLLWCLQFRVVLNRVAAALNAKYSVILNCGAAPPYYSLKYRVILNRVMAASYCSVSNIELHWTVLGLRPTVLCTLDIVLAAEAYVCILLIIKERCLRTAVEFLDHNRHTMPLSLEQDSGCLL